MAYYAGGIYNTYIISNTCLLLFLLTVDVVVPLSMQMPPPPQSYAKSIDVDNDIILQSKCRCRKVIIDISLPSNPNNNLTYAKVWNCHCVNCRKYHMTAYASYLQVKRSQVIMRRGHDVIGKFTSSCKAIEGTDNDIERWYCTKCSGKLLSAVGTSNENDNCWVNMGPLKDESIPQLHAKRWAQQLKQIENNIQSQSTTDNNTCRWINALPNRTRIKSNKYDAPPTRTKWSGGCSCGVNRYEIDVSRLTQLQHCYCNICRELSGGPFMTWLPIDKDNFEWKQSSSETLSLVRTTPFGRRHICQICRGVLTIVYDSQPDLIWPCAGGLDDACLPDNSEEMGGFLNRVCHICCRDKPPWLQLPNDGMERLDDAC